VKTYWGEREWSIAPCVLTSTLVGDEWSASRPGRLTTGECGRVGPRAGLDGGMLTKARPCVKANSTRGTQSGTWDLIRGRAWVAARLSGELSLSRCAVPSVLPCVRPRRFVTLSSTQHLTERSSRELPGARGRSAGA
jgi:hypothetical protein